MSGTDAFLVRPAAQADAAALADIYNHYVLHTAVTFDLSAVAAAQRAEWIAAHPPTGRHRLLVAQREGRVIGYASSSRFNPKAAYDTSVETSIYVCPEATRGGVGTRLYEALFAALAGEDVHRAYAGITLPNEASVALHHRFGFRPAGLYREVGRKLGRYWDVQWFEKPLDGPAAEG